MIRTQFWLVAAILMYGVSGCQSTHSADSTGSSSATASIILSSAKNISRIAFGSCAKQDRLQPVWESILREQPDVFLMIGDNVYGDTEDMRELREKYRRLEDKPGFRQLRQTALFLATWDDHDYGQNDAGADYPRQKESQEIFLDFLGLPQNDPRRAQEGIYHAQIFGPPGQQVQFILLDTRYFRSPLKTRSQATDDPAAGIIGSYVAHEDPHTTLLGEAQWKWLEEQLRQKADIRIIASSIQVISEEHGFEKWMNFPHERQRLYQLVRDTQANGVVFISGDRHLAELSRMDGGVGYELYDLTSSGLNQDSNWYNELNQHRWGSTFRQANFGMIVIDWKQPDPLIHLEIRNVNGTPVIRHTIRLSQIRIKP